MRPTLALAPVAALALWTLLPAPAEAGGFHFGTGFRIGGLHFNIGYRHHDRDYYYRTRHHLSSHRYRCTDRCYVDRGHYYHHQSCPVLHGHLYRYGYEPYRLFSSYAPRSAPPPSYRYRRHDYPERYYYRYDHHHHRHHRHPHRYPHRE